MDELRITNLKVCEAMHKDYGTVDQDLSLAEVQNLMLRQQWDEILVVHNNESLGLVTKEHLLKLNANNIDDTLKIKELCASPLITTNMDTPLVLARDIMRKYSIGRLPVTNEQGGIVGMLTAKDVCNGFSFKLEILGAYMQAVMNNIEEALHVVNSEGLVTFWNDSAVKIFGIDREEIMGQPINKFFSNDRLLDVISSSKTYNNIFEEYRPGFFLLRNFAPVKTFEGELLGAVCTSLNVSHYISLIDKLDAVTSKVRNLERHSSYTIEKKRIFYTANPKTEHMLQQACRVAMTNATILIQGESGTGKERLAGEIYRHSKRFGRPFVEVNCSAIPSTLFESEMFGYESGAFTGGSKHGRKGKFEMANGGTILFDEISEMPLDLQAKLLRVIQERRFYRLGGTSAIEADVRIIAASNRRIEDMVKANEFRQDLYYRLNVVLFNIPPLRERPEDIPGLADIFLRDLSVTYLKPIVGIDYGVMELLKKYDWPGNVRQLQNMLETLVILTDGDTISEDSLIEANFYETLTGASREPSSSCRVAVDDPLVDILEQQEKSIILHALRDNHYNKAKVARFLGIPRGTLYYKMKSLGISGARAVVGIRSAS